MKTKKITKPIIITGCIIIAAILLALVLIPRIQQFQFDTAIHKNLDSGNAQANSAIYDEMIRKNPSPENYLRHASNFVSLEDYEAVMQDIGTALGTGPPRAIPWAPLTRCCLPSGGA